jgi:hypothetical protein
MRLPADRFEKSETSGEFLLELKSELTLSQRLIGGALASGWRFLGSVFIVF